MFLVQFQVHQISAFLSPSSPPQNKFRCCGCVLLSLLLMCIILCVWNNRPKYEYVENILKLEVHKWKQICINSDYLCNCSDCIWEGTWICIIFKNTSALLRTACCLDTCIARISIFLCTSDRLACIFSFSSFCEQKNIFIMHNVVSVRNQQRCHN
jgi:hypothetical protein